jgi:hypothetical protein
LYIYPVMIFFVLCFGHWIRWEHVDLVCVLIGRFPIWKSTFMARALSHMDGWFYCVRVALRKREKLKP